MNLIIWLTLYLLVPGLISVFLGFPSAILIIKGTFMLWPYSKKAISQRALHPNFKLKGITYFTSGLLMLVIMAAAISCFFVIVLAMNPPTALT